MSAHIFDGAVVSDVGISNLLCRRSNFSNLTRFFSVFFSQLLEIFDSVTNGTLDRMNSIVKSAVNLCTALYVGVGFFGYIAYYKRTLSGNSDSHYPDGLVPRVLPNQCEI